MTAGSYGKLNFIKFHRKMRQKIGVFNAQNCRHMAHNKLFVAPKVERNHTHTGLACSSPTRVNASTNRVLHLCETVHYLLSEEVNEFYSLWFQRPDSLKLSRKMTNRRVNYIVASFRKGLRLQTALIKNCNKSVNVNGAGRKTGYKATAIATAKRVIRKKTNKTHKWWW